MQTYENEDLAKVLEDGIKKVLDRLSIEVQESEEAK